MSNTPEQTSEEKFKKFQELLQAKQQKQLELRNAASAKIKEIFSANPEQGEVIVDLFEALFTTTANLEYVSDICIRNTGAIEAFYSHLVGPELIIPEDEFFKIADESVQQQMKEIFSSNLEESA